jgi:hypothetical protein
MEPFYNQKKGVSVIIVFLIMAICVSVALGISGILVGQFKIANSMGDSVRAIYLADSGIEKTLYYDKNSNIILEVKSGLNLSNLPVRGICGSAALNLIGGYTPSGSCSNYQACSDCTITNNGSILPNYDLLKKPFNKFDMTIKINTANAAETSTDSLFQSTGSYGGTSRLIELDILK